MESLITILVLLSVIAGVIITCRGILNRKRQQQIQTKAVTKLQQKLISEHPSTNQEPLLTIMREEQLAALAEVAQPKKTHETKLINEEEKQPPVAEELQQIIHEELRQSASVEFQPTTSKELEQIVRQEIQPELMQETQPSPMTDPQFAMAEKSQPTVDQKVQLGVEEEDQPLSAEQVLSIYTESTQLKPKSKKPPINRGGRPRALTTHPDKQKECIKNKIHTQKPEIICWKKERQWILGVEVPETLIDNSELIVFQNGLPLFQDESKLPCWYLKHVYGEVIIRWNEGKATQEVKANLLNDGYLLFKLSGKNLDQGRLVKFPYSGTYLVIVPEDWERDETLSGPSPAAPEKLLITGYQAHYFDLEKSGVGKIAFRLPIGQPLIIKAKAPRFELIGRRLEDASERMGPLFGVRPPQIRALDVQSWKDVSTVIVGEEGSVRGKWKTAFKPDPNRREQELPIEVEARSGGWYFLRFYDKNDDLIESMDFRFLSFLKEIRISRRYSIPDSEGHRPVIVEFLHEPSCIVQPTRSLDNIRVELQNDKTILTILPDPVCDESHWIVGSAGLPQIEVTINVERIWWAVGKENNPPSEWQDRPVTLSCNDFKATSGKALWLRLPRRGWTDRVLVGFEKSKARPYYVKVTETIVCIPLRDFCDSPELRDPNIPPLTFWLQHQETNFCQILCNITVIFRCTRCEHSFKTEQQWANHFKEKHIHELFSQLNYSELREIIPSLPPAIYQCSYCEFYVPSNDLKSPTSAICYHIQYECERVSREGAPVQLSFRVVLDVDEVRRAIIKDLPHLWKCKLCGNRVSQDNEKALLHLIDNHRDDIYNLT